MEVMIFIETIFILLNRKSHGLLTDFAFTRILVIGLGDNVYHLAEIIFIIPMLHVDIVFIPFHFINDFFTLGKL